MSSSGAAYGNESSLPLAEQTLAASAASPTSPSFAAPSAASSTLLVLRSLRGILLSVRSVDQRLNLIY